MTTYQLYDTQIDTQKNYVSMTTKFIIRNDVVNKEGLSPIYLVISSGGKRERVNTTFHVKASLWDKKNQAVKPVDQAHQTLNLVLEHTKSRVTEIKVRYHLEKRILTPSYLREELIQGNHRTDFVPYMKHKIKEDKSLSKGTARRYTSVANNLERYKSGILFTDITEQFIEKYRNHMLGKGLLSTTVNGNIIAIKHYLKLAKKKDGIHLQVDLDDVKGGATTGNRTSLSPVEVRTLARYFFAEKLQSKQQLTLGYFLFSCMTGLRISDVMSLRRNQLFSEDFAFTNFKTSKDQIITLNRMAKKILDFLPQLFIVKETDSTMNKHLKRIGKNNRITKPLTFHVARHTFATNFLRMNGKLEHLQKLLGHSKIDTTMIYVHILASEANAEIHKLDDLFKDFGFELDLEEVG